MSRFIQSPEERTAYRILRTRGEFPLEPVMGNGHWINADPILRGAIITCLFEWWVAGCPPEALDGELQSLSRMATMSYRRHARALNEAIEQLKTPLLKIYHRKTDNVGKYAEMREKSRQNIVAFNAKKKKIAEEKRLLADRDEMGGMSIAPKKQYVKHHDNEALKTDPDARIEAIRRIKASPKAFKPGLRDNTQDTGGTLPLPRVTETPIL